MMHARGRGGESGVRRARGVFFGWYVVLACFFIALFAWGLAFYGNGVYLAALRARHGWSTALIASATTAFYLVGAALLTVVSTAIERFGPQRVVLLGMMALSAGVLALAVVTAPWQLYVAYLAMAVGWATMSLTAITTILAAWFVRRRGFAISLALNGASAGGILVAPALVYLTGSRGFATALIAVVAAMLLILVPLVTLCVRRRPEDLGVGPDGDPSPPGDGRARPRSPAAGASGQRAAALRDVGFWTIAIPFAFGLTAQVGFLTHQIAFLTPALGTGGTGLAVALTTGAAVAGRVGLGLVVDRLDQRLTTAAAFGSQAVALLVLAVAGEPVALYLACLGYGLSVGNVITLPALLVQREFAPAAFGTVIGLVMALSQVTFAFGPGLLGLARDLSGNYDAALALCIALKVAAALIVLGGRRRRTPRGTTPR